MKYYFYLRINNNNKYIAKISKISNNIGNFFGSYLD